jgi:hypothetical protein
MVISQGRTTRPRSQRQEASDTWEGVARLGKTIVIADDPLEALR